MVSYLVAVLLIAVGIFAMPFFAGEANADPDQADIGALVTETQDENEYTAFIGEENLAKLKSVLEKSKMAKDEINKEIYRKLGYSNEAIDRISIHEIEIMEMSN